MGNMIASVPYKSQEDSDAHHYRNDCGPACAAMVLEWAGKGPVTIDALSGETSLAAQDNGLSCGAVVALLARNGVTARLNTVSTLFDVFAEIMAGRPVIALIGYAAIKERENQRDGAGHFVVVVGYDDTRVYLNDPDWWGAQRDHGAGLAVSLAEFAVALRVSPAPNSAIFVVS